MYIITTFVQFWMILIYIALLLLLIYYLVTKNHNYWKSKRVPFEKPFLVFGNFYDIVRGKQHFSEKIREIYTKHTSPYVGIYIFNQPALMVRSPELLKKVMVKDFDKFVNRPIASDESVDPIAFHTLFSAKDATWRNLRAKLTPVFTSGKMKLMLPLMKECTNDLVNYLKENQGRSIDAKDVCKRYSVDVISSCAFGINAYSVKNKNSEILKMAMQLVDVKSIVRSISIFSFFFMPSLVKIFRLTVADPAACRYFINVFDRTMKEREKLKVERHDLIDLLYSLKKNETFADTYKFNDITMAAQSLSFFSAGNDTTSSFIAFALYELAVNRDIQKRLRDEVNENEDFTYENLQQSKYLDMVLKETHRKYPISNFLNRELTKDYTFEETGLTLKKGDQVFIPLSGLHYDPAYYPEPKKFDPERFSDENKGNIKPYTYMPFGDGPRVCIGERFANLVSKLALATVVKNFEIELSNATPVPLELNNTSLFLQSKDLYLKMTQIKC